MVESANKELVRELFAAIDALNYDRLRELWPADMVCHVVGAPEPFDREAVIAFIQHVYAAFPDNTHEIHEIIAEGDRIAVRFTNHATHQGEFEGMAATGHRISWDAMHMGRIVDGVIREWWVQEDDLGQMSQLGMQLIPPEPKIIQRLATAAYPSFAMLAGMQLDLFTSLKDGPMSAEKMAGTIGVKSSKLEPLLYALVAAELLTVKGALFSNTNEANRFLVADNPSYIGDHAYINPMVMAWNWDAALKTAESIRTGVPQIEYDFSALSEDEAEGLFRGTQPIAVRAGRELAARYDFSSCRTLLDVGGGSGGLAVAITKACSHIRATVADLPSVTPVTRRLVRQADAGDQVRVMTADVVGGPLTGSFDVVVLRAFIQVLSPDQARRALRNVADVVNPGGVVYILGHILDDSRISPLEEVGHGIVYLNLYDVPAPYTEQEHRDWLTEAGLGQIERDALPNGDGVMRARNPDEGKV